MRCAVLGARRLMTVDELRRGIEAIPEADYLRLSYYQRWIRSITDNLLRKGVITEAELRAALERDRRLFAPGDPVRVKDDWPETRGPCHIRTPHYLRGARRGGGAPSGRISRTRRTWPSPARPSSRALYHVRVRQPRDLAGGEPGDERCWSRFSSTGWSRAMNILETDGERLLAAVRGLLADKGIASPRGDRRADRASPMRPTRRRARAWWPRPGPTRRSAR